MTPQEFIEKYLPFARDIETRWGVPVSLSLAQSALETGWGRSVPEGSNNLFGIKMSDGYPHMTVTTKEDDGTGLLYKTQAGFNIYQDPGEAFEHYAKILHKDHFISSGWKGLDSISAIFKIQSGEKKYATDTKYADKIANIIETYDLKQYDSVQYDSVPDGSNPFDREFFQSFQSSKVNPKPKEVEEYERLKEVPIIGGLLGWLWKEKQIHQNRLDYWEEQGGLGETIKKNLPGVVEEFVGKGSQVILTPVMVIGVVMILILIIVVASLSLVKGGSTS